MYAPEPRGRVIALDVLAFSPSSPLSSQFMIAVTTTRCDDGHVSAWFVENHGSGRWWPTHARLDPSLLYNDMNNPGMLAMGLTNRWTMTLGKESIRLDELQVLCLRSPLPEPELGEDHSTWCLDILVKLEQRGTIVPGQALQIERWLEEVQKPVNAMQFRGLMFSRPTSPVYGETYPLLDTKRASNLAKCVSAPQLMQNLMSVSVMLGVAAGEP